MPKFAPNCQLLPLCLMYGLHSSNRRRGFSLASLCAERRANGTAWVWVWATANDHPHFDLDSGLIDNFCGKSYSSFCQFDDLQAIPCVWDGFSQTSPVAPTGPPQRDASLLGTSPWLCTNSVGEIRKDIFWLPQFAYFGFSFATIFLLIDDGVS